MTDISKEIIKPPGFGSGFRQGLGFMAAVLLVLGSLATAFLAAAWITYGSIRNMAVAAVRDIATEAGGVTRVVTDEAKAKVARARDAAVDGASSVVRRAGDTARDAGDAVRSKAAVASETAAAKAAEAKDSLKDRLGGLMGRLRGKPEADPVPRHVEIGPSLLEGSAPTQGGGAAPNPDAKP